MVFSSLISLQNTVKKLGIRSVPLYDFQDIMDEYVITCNVLFLGFNLLD